MTQRKMKRAIDHPSETGSRDAGTVRSIRGILGRTQSELAGVLGVSTKAVQSYEQGWRPVPARVMIQLLVLVALYRQQTEGDLACWEVRECPPDVRATCPAFTVGKGKFCWLIGCKASLPKPKRGEKDLLPCMRCLVVQRLLRGGAPAGSPGRRERDVRRRKRSLGRRPTGAGGRGRAGTRKRS